MVETDERHFECPKCGWVISFRFDYRKNKYISTCPYCMNRLEMDKEEYEDNDMEYYFKPDF